ncbi:MAG TPA: type ISP restriction/modification enzyme [Thermodesulfobacteriota bacterium]|nr:type ISP restriction/modification enzyme [Thermodesulfobacteriota bacterium]
MGNFQTWNEYFKEIKRIGTNATEHSFRTALENTLNSIKSRTNIETIHEPKREQGFGAPDFRVEAGGASIGYIETKPLGTDLDKVLKSKQIDKYLLLNPNLILTNYYEFMLIKEDKKVIERCNLFYLTDLDNKRSQLKAENINAAEALFKKFFLSDSLKIAKSQELAVHMADRGKIVKDYILEILTSKEDDRFSKKILGLYEVFKKTLVEDLKEDEFADAYAQTVIYGFFLAFLQSGKKITLEDASRLIPLSFKVIKEFFDVINDYSMPSHMKWIFGEIVNLINNIDLEGIYRSLSFKKRWETAEKDPYLYFYEDFLGKFDPSKKKARGVYYTPFSVVSFITRSTDKLLAKRFNKANGFADPSVTVLDFATGTGTFLVSIFELIFDRMKDNRGKLRSIIKEHLLKNFYGFEYLVAPYAVAHLKLSQLLKDNDYELEDNERLQIYLTDTLDDSKHQTDYLMPALSEEGEDALEIKVKKKILVVTGNPPYNVKSRNNKPWIKDKLLKDYKPEDEKNIQPLNDDYIKFIRYAHWKMQQTEQGVMGIITNNSFLNGLIHRKMREKLFNDFDEIYILNLHGSSRIGETAPEGIDENVFDIQQGVAISLFVKRDKRDTECKVFYHDLYGTREHKNSYLMENDIDTVKWDELNIEEFNTEFRKTKWGKNRFAEDLNYFVPTTNVSMMKDYGDFWGMTEIFREHHGGVKTHRDHFVIGSEPNELLVNFQKFIKNDIDFAKKELKLKNTVDFNIEQVKQKLKDTDISNYIIDFDYRPFDIRKIIYHPDLVDRDRYSIMQHLLRSKNIGFVFMRQVVLNVPYSHFFIVGNIIDNRAFASSLGHTSVAPLYLYQDNPKGKGLFDDKQGLNKIPNFTPDFQKFIRTKYSFQPTPEEILGYIYAVFYSPSYRDRYLEFLKIDFPRVPFVDDENIFKELSVLGMELIEHHLMKKSYPGNVVTFSVASNDEVENVKFEKGKVYINKTQYFDNIPSEVWEFYVGGYQVLDKWLKSRKYRTLSYEEKETFTKIVNILDFTIKQMGRIDEVVKKMG